MTQPAASRRYRCSERGHVLVDGDVLHECLVCGKAIRSADRIGLIVRRDREPADPAGIAAVPEWGPAKLT